MPLFPAESVRFTLTAHQGWFGRVRGTIEDDPMRGVPGRASVSGRLRDGELSFVKRYPVAYVHIGDRSVTLREHLEVDYGLIIDRDIQGLPIIYRGGFDNTGETIRGTWQFDSAPIRFRSRGAWMCWNVLESSPGGEWFLRRVAAF